MRASTTAIVAPVLVERSSPTRSANSSGRRCARPGSRPWRAWSPRSPRPPAALVFFETLEDDLPPARSISSFIWLRVSSSSAPVIAPVTTTVIPANGPLGRVARLRSGVDVGVGGGGRCRAGLGHVDPGRDQLVDERRELGQLGHDRRRLLRADAVDPPASPPRRRRGWRPWSRSAGRYGGTWSGRCRAPRARRRPGRAAGPWPRSIAARRLSVLVSPIRSRPRSCSRVRANRSAMSAISPASTSWTTAVGPGPRCRAGRGPRRSEMEATGGSRGRARSASAAGRCRCSAPHRGHTSGNAIGRSSPVRRCATGASTRGITSPAL